MMVPSRRPDKPHSCNSVRSPRRQWAATKPRTVTKPNKSTKTMMAVQFTAVSPCGRLLLRHVCFSRARVDEHDDQRRENDPNELVPIEEGDAEEHGIKAVIKRHPQQRHERDQEQEVPPTWMSGSRCRASGRCGH